MVVKQCHQYHVLLFLIVCLFSKSDKILAENAKKIKKQLQASRSTTTSDSHLTTHVLSPCLTFLLERILPDAPAYYPKDLETGCETLGILGSWAYKLASSLDLISGTAGSTSQGNVGEIPLFAKATSTVASNQLLHRNLLSFQVQTTT